MLPAASPAVPAPSAAIAGAAASPSYPSRLPRRQLHTPATVRAPTRDIWLRPSLRRNHAPRFLDRTVDMDALLASISAAETAADVAAAMSPYSGGSRSLSVRFLCSLLSRIPDWRRSLSLLDWMFSPSAGAYPPSVLPFNVVLRNAARAGELQFAIGLLHEMRAPPNSLNPDAVSYSTLIAALTSAGHLEQALQFLPLMDADRVRPDLVLYSNLMHLSLRLSDASKAIALFNRLVRAGIRPDLTAYNAAISAFAAANLLREAKRVLFRDMPENGVSPDAASYSALLSALAKRRRYLAVVSLFAHMRNSAAGVSPDLTIYNIVIHAYGQLDLAREADRLFWSMRRAGVAPGVVTYNTMLRVYGDAGLFGEAIHLFRLLRDNGTSRGVGPNVVTYNTMIAIYGKSLEHEKAGNLLQEMQSMGIDPNAITYSTIMSIWAKAGKLDRAAKLFQKLRESGAEIDPVLYQTMVVAYERAGLVAHARRLLGELKQPEGVPRETAIKILANAGRVEEAAWVFRRAAEAGEVKDPSVHRSMMELFARNRRHRSVVEVFDELRKAGHFPDSEMIAIAMNAYAKLQEFNKAAALYREMEGECCTFSDGVHFQMLSLLGAKRDFAAVEELFGKLSRDANIDKRELYLVVAGVLERGNRLDEAARIMAQIRNSNSLDEQ